MIRPARADDVETLAGFAAAMALETEDKALDRDTVHRGITRLIEDPSLGLCLVAAQGDAVLGTLSVTHEWSDWRCGLFWWIQSVYVRPEARGDGVFTALYRHVEALARSTPEVCGLRLYVERDNTRAQRTYARLGMVEADYRIYEAEF